MAAKTYFKGTVVEAAGKPVREFHLITEGSVRAVSGNLEIILKRGDVIGIADASYTIHSFTYTANEDVSVVSFSAVGKNALRDLCQAKENTTNGIAKFFYNSAVSQTLAILSSYLSVKADCADIYDMALDYYEQYKDICKKNKIVPKPLPQFDTIERLSLREDVEPWLMGYYASHREFSDEIRNALPTFPAFVTGLIYRASYDVHSTFPVLLEMNTYYKKQLQTFFQESSVDLFDVLTSLYLRLPETSPELASLSDVIEEFIDFSISCPGSDTRLIKERVSAFRAKKDSLSGVEATTDSSEEAAQPTRELTNTMDTIIEYSKVSSDVANRFKTLVNGYKKMSDKSASSDEARTIRNELAKSFFDIYSAVFLVSVKDTAIPTLIKMFLNFGFVDEELAGQDNTAYLYKIADNYTGDENNGIYTAYGWLKAVYLGKKDPSRNEFDTDYLAYLHEMKVQGKITAEEEKELADDSQKRFRFELENMFQLVNKLTYGRITTYCPVFSAHNVIKPLPGCIITPDVVESSLQSILSVDYSAFNRETVYTNEKLSIPKEYVSVKVLPDIILMPNVGTREIMWQEIEGRKRTTPARFMISAFHLEDIQLSFTKLVGEYRWEMCKRIQGPRWNDVTDRSLTSEYFDYIQFYKKNSELSDDAKEKIKQGLVKAKNSYKEMFVRDYVTWVVYEGNGSPRLNKLVRSMMCSYCPFPFDLRKKLVENPLYKELLERYEIKTAQKIHHISNVILKLGNAGATIPPEILETKKYYEGR